MYYKFRGFLAGFIFLLALSLSLGYGTIPRLLVAGLALMLGLYLRLWARASIGEHSRGSSLECPELLTRGAYGHCRHPLYVSSWWIGVAWLMAQKWPSQLYFGVFLGLWTAHFVYLSVGEDRFLRMNMGDVWLRFAQEVPFWRFVPRFEKVRWRPALDLWTWLWLLVAFLLPLIYS